MGETRAHINTLDALPHPMRTRIHRYSYVRLSKLHSCSDNNEGSPLLHSVFPVLEAPDDLLLSFF